MPTILTFNGIRVCIYLNDHRPAHVHVMGNGNEAVFRLNCPGGPPDLRENYGFAGKDLNKIAVELIKQIRAACREWEKLHALL